MIRSLPSRLLAVAFTLLSEEAFVSQSNAESKTFEINFKSLTTGLLTDQGEWRGLKNIPSPLVVKDAERGLVAAANPDPENPAGSATAVCLLQNFHIKPDSELEIVFDVCKNGEGPGMAAVGLGSEANLAKSNAYVGMVGNRWRINDKEAVNAAGKAIYPDSDKWIRVRCTMHLAANGTGTATLELMNLTKGETEYKPVYFDAAQTVTSVALGYAPRTEHDWKQLGVRLNVGKTDVSTRTGLIDQITLTSKK